MTLKKIIILITIITTPVWMGSLGLHLTASVTAQEIEQTAVEDSTAPPQPSATPEPIVITYTADAASQAQFTGEIPAGKRVVSQIMQPGEWGLTTFAPINADTQLARPLAQANNTPPRIISPAPAQAEPDLAAQTNHQPTTPPLVDAPQADNIVTLIKTVGTQSGVCPPANEDNITISSSGNTTLYFCFRIINDGGQTLAVFDLEDDLFGKIYSAEEFTLLPGEEHQLIMSASINNSRTDTAYVSATSTDNETTTDNDTTTITATPPGLEITLEVKEGVNNDCSPAHATNITKQANSFATYCYLLHNTGPTALDTLTLSDNVIGSIYNNYAYTIGAGSTALITRTAYVTQTVSNVATASMEEVGFNTPVNDTSNSAMINVPLPAGIAITKTVKAGAGGACNIQFTSITVPPNSFVTYCYRYTNLGITDLRPLTVIDQDPTLDYWDGSNQGGILYQNFPSTLPAGYTQSFTRTRYITQTVNTNATIWMPERGSGIEVQATSNKALVHVPLPAGIVMTKTAKANTSYCNIASSAISVAPYTKVTYCYRYTNLGIGDLRPLTVIDQDPLLTFWDGSYQGGILFQNFPSTLPAGYTQSFTRTRIISDSITTFATITMTERGSLIDVSYTTAASVDVVENPDICTSLDFDFNSGIDPSITIDNHSAGNPVVWDTVAGSGEAANFTSGSGGAASASSRQQNSGNFDTTMQLPAYRIPLGATQADLTFRANYQNLGGTNADNLDLEISLDTGRSWQTLLNWGEDHGTFGNTPGELVTVDLLPYRGSRSVTLRWRYHDSSSSSEKYYAQIDDIGIICTIALAAADDSGAGFTTDEDTAFTTANVLDNDFDPNGYTLSVQSFNSSNTQGTVTDNGNGTFNYDPNGHFEALAVGEQASDSFTYVVSNGHGDIDMATVTITINGVNDDPSAVNNSGNGFTTDEASSFTTANVLGNDSDPDGSDTFSVLGINNSSTQGIVTNNGNGTFNYNPNGQFEALAVGEQGSDSFTYTISDGHGGSDSATVMITIDGVNDTPSAANDSGASFTTGQNSVFTTASVLDNDSDPDGSDTLSVLSINSSSTQGIVTNNGDGTFTYNPNGQFSALADGAQTTDTFIYTVSDGHGGMDTAVVTITITGGPDTFSVFLPLVVK